MTLAAQPDPKQADIDLILRKVVMPKRLQDLDVKVWRPHPAEAWARLRSKEALPPASKGRTKTTTPVPGLRFPRCPTARSGRVVPCRGGPKQTCRNP
jgi:hypothetical protein